MRAKTRRRSRDQITHGAAVDSNSPNVVAIQFTGVGGGIKIYRR
jgi:hypothetical protein